mgnify:CR=1 FL=1
MISLDATVRDNTTKGQLSAIRDGGNVPAIIYGGKGENEKISISKKLLKNIKNLSYQPIVGNAYIDCNRSIFDKFNQIINIIIRTCFLDITTQLLLHILQYFTFPAVSQQQQPPTVPATPSTLLTSSPRNHFL